MIEVEKQENKSEEDDLIADFPRFELKVSLYFQKAVVEMRMSDGHYRYREEVSGYWNLESAVRGDALNNVIERGKCALNREIAKEPGMIGCVQEFPKLIIEP